MNLLISLLFLFTFNLYASQELNSQINLTPEEKVWIEQNPVIKVGGGPDWAPFDFMDPNGNYIGIVNDYLKLISKKTGLKFNVVIDKWSSNLQKIKANQIDLLGAVYYTKKRTEYMNYTDSYFEMLDYFFIRDDLDVKTIADLDGKIVAMPKGYAHGEIIAKEFPKIKILTVETFSEAIDAVLEKRADILFDTYASLSYVFKKEGINTIVPFKSYRGHHVMKLHMTTSKKQKKLSLIINKALHSITDDEKKKIYKKWLGKNIQRAPNIINLNDKEKKWILENPIVTYSEINWEPMSIIKDNTMVGIMNEYLEIITNKTGLSFQFKKASSWTDVLEKFKTGEIDIIPGIGATDYETSLGLTSSTYSNFPFVLVTKAKEAFISDIKELENKTIAVPKYWTSYNYLVEQQPNIKIIATKNVYEALDLVRDGKAYAFLGHMAIAMHYVGNYYSSSLHIAGKVEYNFNHKILIQRDKEILLEIINKVLVKIPESQHLDIKNKWLKVEVKEAYDYTWLYQVTSILVLFIFGTLYWNRKLSNEIKERLKIEKDLDIEKENFKSLFEKVSDGNLIIQENRFVNCNNAALHMLGLQTKEQLLGTTPNQWSPFIQPDGSSSNEKVALMIKRCMQNSSHRFEWLHKDINDNEFWVDIGLTKISYEGKDAIYVVWRDISEQKLLEENLKNSETQMRTLIDNIPLHVIVSSYEGDILLANPQALKDYKLSNENIPTINTLDFYADANERDEVIQEMKTKGKVHQKIVKLIHPDGEHSMMLSILPITYAYRSAMLSISVDMTKHLKMEKALTEAKNTAELANQSKSEFLANMSHEIRTPMNAIVGFTELLDEQITEPRLKSYVRTIKSASNSLLTLINDILDLSKIEAGKLQINKIPTNIFNLSEEISSIFMMNVRNKGLDFIIEVDENIPKSLLIDEIRLRQVLLNIIGNAVKFTEQGFIRLSVKPYNIDKHHSKINLEFCIKDSGVGIPQTQLALIFKEFEQSEGQDNRKFGGTGLGLSISKRLCEMMDGEITVNSVEGKGATFYINLYDIDISSVIQEKHTHKESSLDVRNIIFEPATILVVDDIENNRELIVRNFENTDLNIITACDGVDAIQKYKEYKPDLILMDIRMPVMDGYDAATEIKKISSIPIVALTASVMHDDFERLKRKDFDGYLRKPVMRYELFLELSNFLKHKKLDIQTQEPTVYTLSEKAKANIDVILNTLDNELLPLHKKALKNNNIDEIKILASKTKALALEYEIDVLEIYASKLYEAIDSFDIVIIQELMREYPSIEV